MGVLPSLSTLLTSSEFFDRKVRTSSSLLFKAASCISWANLRSKNDVIRHFFDRKLAHEIHDAALNNNEEEVRTFLSKNSEDVNKVDRLGRTPMHLATSYGCEEIVKVLINENPETIRKLDKLGHYPLSYVSFTERTNLVYLI